MPSPRQRWLPCDYPACRRAEEVFTRRDAYRDHLRDYHQDIPRRHKNVKREQEWLAQRTLSTGALTWWRCARCLIRVYVESGGWFYPGRQQSCEPERIATRSIPSAERIGCIDVKARKSSGELASRKTTETSTERLFSSTVNRPRGVPTERALKHLIYAEEYAGPFFCQILWCSASNSVFQTQTNLDRHHQEVHLIVLTFKEPYMCDYEMCTEDPTLVKIVSGGYQIRLHLRDHHKEDIYWPRGQSHESEWW